MTDYLEPEWFNKGDIIKAEIWGTQADLRDGLPLILRRVKVYTQTSARDSFSTELVCAGVTLSVAPCQNPENGEWLLKNWIKTLSPILAKYQLQGYIDKPKSISNPDDFMAAVELKTREKK